MSFSVGIMNYQHFIAVRGELFCHLNQLKKCVCFFSCQEYILTPGAWNFAWTLNIKLSFVLLWIISINVLLYEPQSDTCTEFYQINIEHYKVNWMVQLNTEIIIYFRIYTPLKITRWSLLPVFLAQFLHQLIKKTTC